MALEGILAAKRAAVAERMQARPLRSFEGRLMPSDRDFEAALRRRGFGYILECKKASPSLGLLRQDYDPAAIARDYAPLADAISVLTDEPFFQGRLEHIGLVRQAVPLPVLCKDFVVDPYQVFEARLHGADAVLLMLSVLNPGTARLCQQVAAQLGMAALVEVHTSAELQAAVDLGATLVGINNRDLKTLSIRLETTEELAPQVPPGILRISESGLRGHADVRRLRPFVDGFLVGSALMGQSRLSGAARELVHGRVKVCGLTDPADASAAWNEGAVWGGLNFAPESPRCVTLDQARRIRNAAPLSWAGVFVNQPLETIERIALELGLDAVQLHGEEGPGFVQELRRRLGRAEIWKACRVQDRVPTLEETGADRLVLDRHDPQRRGGTGKPFDWKVLAGYPRRDAIVVAGGLGPGNAAEADLLGVWALDVNSGVESAPGRKSEALLSDFFTALRKGSS